MAKYQALPRALLEALGKDYLKKKVYFFAETIFKKKNISLPRALLEALDKDFFSKKNISLPRAWLSLPRAWPGSSRQSRRQP